MQYSRTHKYINKQPKGSAIIVALLIMSLVAILATMMTIQQQAQIQRTSLVLNSDRMYLSGKAVQAWAIMTLTQDIQQAKEQAAESGSTDISNTAIDNIPQQFTGITTANGFQLAGQLTDAQAKFNLNNLTNKKYEKNMANLILAVDPDLDPDKAKAIAKSVHDWISKPSDTGQTEQNTNSQSASNTTTDTSNQSTPANSKINRYYVSRRPPYRAAQALMASASELRLVKGMTQGLYLRLLPFVTALPKFTPININTASAPVIASLSDTIDLQTAIQIVQNRGDQPYDNLNSFLNDETIQKANVKKTDITMNSEYFLATAEVYQGNDKLRLRTLLYRPLPSNNTGQNPAVMQNSYGGAANNDKQPTVTVLWESRGGI